MGWEACNEGGYYDETVQPTTTGEEPKEELPIQKKGSLLKRIIRKIFLLFFLTAIPVIASDEEKKHFKFVPHQLQGKFYIVSVTQCNTNKVTKFSAGSKPVFANITENQVIFANGTVFDVEIIELDIHSSGTIYRIYFKEEAIYWLLQQQEGTPFIKIEVYTGQDPLSSYVVSH